MIHTQLIKIHQNNSTTTTIMEFKLLTQQFHKVHHTHNFTWNSRTNFIIQNHKKSQLSQKHVNP